MRDILYQVEPSFPHKELQFVGRSASAATATGCFYVHKEEEKEVMDAAFRCQRQLP